MEIQDFIINNDVNMHYKYTCTFIGLMKYYNNRLNLIISCKLDKPHFIVGEILNE